MKKHMLKYISASWCKGKPHGGAGIQSITATGTHEEKQLCHRAVGIEHTMPPPKTAEGLFPESLMADSCEI